MMRPLKESVGHVSPIEAEAIALLRAAPGHEPPAGQKQRVRARLLQQRVARRRGYFRPAVVLPVILCAAAASAAAGRHWIAQTVHGLVSPTASQPAARTPSPSARRARAVKEPAAAVQVIEATAPEAPAPAIPAIDVSARVPAAREIRKRVAFAAGARARGPSPLTAINGQRPSVPAVRDESTSSRLAATPLVATPPAADPTHAKGARSTRPAEDTGLVFDAMRALRQEAHPARAQGLLDEYLRRHPTGALAEEALALSVEAAALRRDPRARDLAAAYTSRYPGGHFRAAVEGAIRRLRP